ncbi:CHAP domain-containing protein [Planomonospora sp. ID67723]|uniref:CHAP domain-containing protein n=1 Tax=Planomonospora sp. ID67723 TaxID=2738134 RepID=UPI0018C3647A|nr:CHAP domain-containing protein [Planomonospora sp. ID67723]MBG0829911.1 CHAP domain-containing protein [Planomonospora sp. ID67723]
MGKHRRVSPPKKRHLTRVILGMSVAVTGGAVTAPQAFAAGAHDPLNAPAAEVPQLSWAASAPSSPKTRLQVIAEGLPKVSAAQLLAVAEQQIGIRENSSGGGTKFHSWYMSSPRVKETIARDGGNVQGYANAPWCDMFVSWVGEQVGIRPTVGWDAYTVSHAQWFQNNRHWGDTPRPGALVFFDWSRGDSIYGIDHVGFVKHDNGDGTITTIEGNTGNGNVEQRVRPESEVVGYGYPVYSS